MKNIQRKAKENIQRKSEKKAGKIPEEIEKISFAFPCFSLYFISFLFFVFFFNILFVYLFIVSLRKNALIMMMIRYKEAAEEE